MGLRRRRLAHWGERIGLPRRRTSPLRELTVRLPRESRCSPLAHGDDAFANEVVEQIGCVDERDARSRGDGLDRRVAVDVLEELARERRNVEPFEVVAGDRERRDGRGVDRPEDLHRAAHELRRIGRGSRRRGQGRALALTCELFGIEGGSRRDDIARTSAFALLGRGHPADRFGSSVDHSGDVLTIAHCCSVYIFPCLSTPPTSNLGRRPAPRLRGWGRGSRGRNGAGSAPAAHELAKHAALRARLLAWYASARRDLPWRRTRDPYAVWISETMLQQTRVDTVIPYYERFLRDLPTLGHLAEAPQEQVLGLWSGLGYYRRARMLHAAAKQAAVNHAGAVPSEVEDLRKLAGIGAYTAGAVASIAFGRRAAVVDGNVARVLARVFAIEDDVKAAAGLAKIWRLAEALVPEPREGEDVAISGPGAWNLALMEPGAT